MIKAIASTILMFLSLISCDSQKSRTDQKEPVIDSIEQEIKKIPENELTVILYEGCEYIIYKEDKDANSSFGFMAHKGNCNNPIHKCN
jgi:hypothetical protein